MPTRKLTKQVCDGAVPKRGKVLFLWDAETPGFGLRITPKGVKAFVFQYRNGGNRTVRRTIGKYGGGLTVKAARRIAETMRLEVRQGGDPARERDERAKARTVRDLIAVFLENHGPKRARNTVRNYRMIFKHHVLPAMGSRLVEEVTWNDVHRLHGRMGEKTPIQANRMLTVLGKLFEYAKRTGDFPRELPNPARGHDPYPESRTRGRALTREELRQLGEALTNEDGSQAAAVWVVLLTGLRPAEVRLARWEELSEDGRVLRLKQTKTGPRVAYLGNRAAGLVAEQPRLSEWIFPGRLTVENPYGDLRYTWEKVREAAGLPGDTRLYDAGRHTFTTVAQEELGLPRWRVALLVGHVSGDGSMTGRYTHAADRSLLNDADRVSDWLWEALTGESTSGEVVSFPGTGETRRSG